MAWSKAATVAEPDMVTDMARVSAVEATATKIRKVDEQKKTQAIKRRKSADASSLRQPGEGAEVEEEENDKARFIEPLAQLMMDCAVGRTENASATDEEFMSSLRRKATRVVKASGIPTLHIAIITADELRKYLESRETHMGVDKVEPIVLEGFLWQSRARVRVVNAICWMCKNLQLGWPIDSVERPDTKKASLIGMECKQAPAAQPGMLKAFADAIEAGAETGDPIWLAIWRARYRPWQTFDLFMYCADRSQWNAMKGGFCSSASAASRSITVLDFTGECHQRRQAAMTGARSSWQNTICGGRAMLAKK
jgi:hypothetical protein